MHGRIEMAKQAVRILSEHVFMVGAVTANRRASQQGMCNARDHGSSTGINLPPVKGVGYQQSPSYEATQI